MGELLKIVVVIDSDNTQLTKISDVFQEISTRGRIVVKRAYGNWRKESLKKWEAECKRLAIRAVQQFDYVSGKNASDMALLIDTIELLYRNIYDTFVIVSSDSDYTPLAIKLRESGVYVIGVGEKKTPVSFKNACDEFLLLENLSFASDTVSEETGTDSEKAVEAEESADSVKAGNMDDINEVHDLLKKAHDRYQKGDGFANVAAVGSFLMRTKSDFDCRTYGYTKLPALLEAFPDKYELKRYKGKGTVTIVAYRCIG